MRLQVAPIAETGKLIAESVAYLGRHFLGLLKTTWWPVLLLCLLLVVATKVSHIEGGALWGGRVLAFAILVIYLGAQLGVLVHRYVLRTECPSVLSVAAATPKYNRQRLLYAGLMSAWSLFVMLASFALLFLWLGDGPVQGAMAFVLTLLQLPLWWLFGRFALALPLVALGPRKNKHDHDGQMRGHPLAYAWRLSHDHHIGTFVVLGVQAWVLITVPSVLWEHFFASAGMPLFIKLTFISLIGWLCAVYFFVCLSLTYRQLTP